jgi:hypothetical protein
MSISTESKASASKSESLLILLICVAAALRIFVFSSAFPFFSNIDEDLHFDLIVQYSNGSPPHTFAALKGQTLNWIIPYASPEFLFRPDQFPAGKFPPPLWKQSGPTVESEIAATRDAWSAETNFESSQPPLYYVLASVWWWMGQRLGWTGLPSLYWIRFLNGILIALMVLLGYLAARTIAPERVELRLGLPLLLAFIPQNVFFALNNDVLSPLCFGGLFLCVLQWLRTDRPTLLLGIMTGLTISATYLTKLTNLPLIIVALVAVITKLLIAIRQEPRAFVTAFVVLAFCTAVPIASWILWTKYQFGDVTGSTAKITLLGWTRKPPSEWWQHPIFTMRGLSVFWWDLITTFWRGEAKWCGQPLNCLVTDAFYAVSTPILLGAALLGLRKGASLSIFQRQAIGIAALCFIASVGFLALLSLQFDFGNCINPSRAHPYFTSGRLLSGAFIPFGLLYVYGLSWLLRRINPALPFLALGIILLLMIASEIAVNRVVFGSEHNLFHL